MMGKLEETALRSVPSGLADRPADPIDDCTESQFEALVTLHMLKPGQILSADYCWAIECTRQQADAVQNNAVDAFDDGRKYGIVSVAGLTDAAIFEKIGELQSRLAVEKAMNGARQRNTAEALQDAYRFISQPKRMTPTEATYSARGYNELTAKIRAAIAMATGEPR